mmetsp:Transcript_62101/g.152804  ORF Transcript_62101/g.152804 Transcript_62101/m.152804 type:complete len:307 (-) Transcript_62101:328-1248(-)
MRRRFASESWWHCMRSRSTRRGHASTRSAIAPPRTRSHAARLTTSSAVQRAASAVTASPVSSSHACSESRLSRGPARDPASRMTPTSLTSAHPVRSRAVRWGQLSAIAARVASPRREHHEASIAVHSGTRRASSTMPASVTSGPMSACLCTSITVASKQYRERSCSVQSVTNPHPPRRTSRISPRYHRSRSSFRIPSVILWHTGSGVSVFHEMSRTAQREGCAASRLKSLLSAATRSTTGTRGQWRSTRRMQGSGSAKRPKGSSSCRVCASVPRVREGRRGGGGPPERACAPVNKRPSRVDISWLE